jgi:NADH dehydrogenase (ubiquinone) 1 alpha subcomplex subunit 5
LSKLQSFPESSLYRASVESLTKHRLALVEKLVPPGYEEWAVRAKKLVSDNPDQFRLASGKVDGSNAHTVRLGNKTFIVGRHQEERDIRYEEWDGEKDEGPELEGMRTEEERKDQVLLGERRALEDHAHVQLEPEPQLTADQYATLSRGHSRHSSATV